MTLVHDLAALAGLYKGQCVGAHGFEHLSHEKRSKYAVESRWQSSVTDTIALLKNSFDGTSIFLPLFRPPYGQRKSDSGAFFQREGLQVALWNMDSQDWNAQIEAEDIINRMEILMLIKRRGVLLFHDIHPKAQKAVPVIIAEFGIWKAGAIAAPQPTAIACSNRPVARSIYKCGSPRRRSSTATTSSP